MTLTRKSVFTISILIIIIGASLFFIMQRPSSIGKNTIRIGYLPIVQGLPLYIAKEKGYFTNAGMDTELVRFDSPQLILNALIAGQIDIGAPSTASGITGIVEYQKPGLLKVFALIGDDDTTTNYVLLVREDSTFTSIADLRGKKLGILPGIQFRTLAQHTLAQNGLSIEKDVSLIELAPALHVQALAAHQVDALLTLEPARTIARLQHIGKELVKAPGLKFIANPFYGSVGVMRTTWMQEYPKEVEKILAVFQKTMQEIRSDPTSAKQFLKGYTALDDQLIQEVPLPIFKMYSEFSTRDINALQQWFDVFTKYGIISKSINARNLIYAPPTQ